MNEPTRKILIDQKLLKRLVNRAAHQAAALQEMSIQREIMAKCMTMLRQGKRHNEVASELGLLMFLQPTDI